MLLRNGARSLATSSHSTIDSIFTRQNDSFLLQCQAAQKNEYSSAKRIAHFKTVITLIFAVISVAASALNFDLLTALSGLFAVIVGIANRYLDTKIRVHKRHAAFVQQYIDATLFAAALGNDVSDWGEVPNRSDLAETISKYGNTDTSQFVNWYSDYSLLKPEAQVFYCQSENVRWNCDLNKKYKRLQICFAVVVTVVLIIAFVVFNPSFIKAVCILSWCLPIIEYAFSIIIEVNNSANLMDDMKKLRQDIEKKMEKSSYRTIMADLIKLQRRIWDCRTNCYLIPDCFYKCYRAKHQEKEDNIAKTIQNKQ